MENQTPAPIPTPLPLSGKIAIDDFKKVELRVGKVIKVEDFPEARKPTHKMWIDFGEFGVKPCAAQIAHAYTKEQMLGRTLICVTNFNPRNIAGFSSEVMLLAAHLDDNKLSLLQPDREVPPGKRIG